MAFYTPHYSLCLCLGQTVPSQQDHPFPNCSLMEGLQILFKTPVPCGLRAPGSLYLLCSLLGGTSPLHLNVCTPSAFSLRLPLSRPTLPQSSALKGPGTPHSCSILCLSTSRNSLRVWAYLSLFLQHLGHSLNYDSTQKLYVE